MAHKNSVLKLKHDLNSIIGCYETLFEEFSQNNSDERALLLFKISNENLKKLLSEFDNLPSDS